MSEIKYRVLNLGRTKMVMAYDDINMPGIGDTEEAALADFNKLKETNRKASVLMAWMVGKMTGIIPRDNDPT